MKQLHATLIFLLAAVMSISASAKPAGKVEFDDLSQYYGEPKVEINLDKSLLGLLGTFARHEDPDIAELLVDVDEVTVRVYRIGNEAEEAVKLLEKLSGKIRGDRWQPIVSVNEDKEKVRIFSRLTGGVMDGLVVMVVDTASEQEREAVFINIVGQIDPANVHRVTETLGQSLGV